MDDTAMPRSYGSDVSDNGVDVNLLSGGNSSLTWDVAIATTMATVLNRSESDRMDSLAMDLFLYCSPVICILGLLGNMLTMVVLWSRDFQHPTLKWTLSALAISDTCALLIRHLPVWSCFVSNRTISFHQTVTCKSFYFFWYYIPHVCSFFVVLVTIERTISVCDPIRAKVLCSVRRVQFALVTVLLGLGLANIPVALEWSLVRSERRNQTRYTCKVAPEWDSFNNSVWVWIDIALLSVIPLTVIVTCNVVIIQKLSKFRKARRVLTSCDTDHMDSVVASTAIMLVVVSVVFLLTTLPSTVYYVLETYWFSTYTALSTSETKLARSKLFLTSVVCNLLYYLNNSINFLLYCISGSYFRRTLRRIFYRRVLAFRRAVFDRPPSSASTKIFKTINDHETVQITTM